MNQTERMQETTFFFVRHGQTDYNKRRIVQGRRIDSTLNATGRTQAEHLARRFADIELDAIYSSTLRRARETTEAVSAEHPDVPVHHLEDLEEMSWGIYEGAPSSPKVARVFEEMNARWKCGEFDRPVEGGESILEVQARALRAVDRIREAEAGGRILVVAHGRFLRVLLSTLLEEYGLHRMHEIHHANTAVNHLVCRGGRFRAELLNCTAHLDEVETIMVE